MRLFLTVILSLFFIQACGAQTGLTREMPEKITVYLNLNGGMGRSYTKITIGDGALEFEERRGNRAEPEKWTAEVSREELAALYKAFVENRFDAIVNDPPKGRAYDAGSENISISIGGLKSFQVTYGKNSPLSGENLARYQAVRKAIDELLAGKQNGRLAMSEAEKFIQGGWRAAGESGIRAWFLEWTFANGRFKQTGYPPIVQEGKYRVESAGDDKLALELYDQTGTFGETPRKIEISIDKEAGELTISNTKSFRRVADRTTD